MFNWAIFGYYFTIIYVTDICKKSTVLLNQSNGNTNKLKLDCRMQKVAIDTVWQVTLAHTAICIFFFEQLVFFIEETRVNGEKKHFQAINFQANFQVNRILHTIIFELHLDARCGFYSKYFHCWCCCYNYGIYPGQF